MLEDSTALITGAGRGIGRACAVAFARHGCKVACVARTDAEIDQTAREIRERGGTAIAVPGDVASADSVRQFTARAIQELGNIDILVNSAGVFRIKSVPDTTIEDWDYTMAVNARGVFLCVKAVLDDMIERKEGCIINIASRASLKPYPEQSAYCASKHAVLGFTKVLADEMRDHNVRVTAICPGGVDTQLVRDKRPDWTPDVLMSPEDVADAAVYIAQLSPMAAIDVLPIRRWPSAPI